MWPTWSCLNDARSPVISQLQHSGRVAVLLGEQPACPPRSQGRQGGGKAGEQASTAGWVCQWNKEAAGR